MHTSANTTYEYIQHLSTFPSYLFLRMHIPLFAFLFIYLRQGGSYILFYILIVSLNMKAKSSSHIILN